MGAPRSGRAGDIRRLDLHPRVERRLTTVRSAIWRATRTSARNLAEMRDTFTALAGQG